ncbi:MAG: sigma-54-dependent Fis family transcriptional regulator [Desulfobacterales bacterium]|nr:sigma-54-dependent Fis family transcriptional regulator [Desulfobacterales bacterium]
MNEPHAILVVDDDDAHRTMLNTLMGGWGYAISQANDGSVAIELVQKQPFDLILMDIRMLKVSGLEALEEIKQINPAIPVIIMTAYSSIDTAVAAIKKGAYDYLTKPLDFERLKLIMERAMEHVSLKAENLKLKFEIDSRFDRQHIIGNGPAMTGLLETVSQVAPSEATALITGASGTGKELVAGAIHFNSPRRKGPFVKINCAAISENLLESEMFGHEKGAFTGADRRKEGRFVQADKGTLFLDEVSEMPLGMQVKLLRVLQERELTRVGGEAVISVDVRVIAATNRNLEKMVAAGDFRQDLYYRLNVVELIVPPLSHRIEDIPLLAQTFLDDFSKKNHKQIKGFTPQAMDVLVHYDWPGNVRELMNAVERAVVLARDTFLDEGNLPIKSQTAEASDQTACPPPTIPDNLPLEEVEKASILQTLKAAGGNKSETARRLGITRKTLHKKLKKYGVM